MTNNNKLIFFLLIFFILACTNKRDSLLSKESKNLIELEEQNDSTFSITDSVALFNLGYKELYFGNYEIGNEIINYSLSKWDSVSAEIYHAKSVLNTKNGNYSIAIEALENAYKLNPKGVCAYYGWVALYYYRDYEKALSLLEKCDSYTPNFSDAPMGEDIHYLKGLTQMALGRYKKAINEFDIYIQNLVLSHGEEFVDLYTYIQKGRCQSKLGLFEESILTYKRALHFSKLCSEAYYFMGLSQISINQKDSACLSLNSSLDLIKRGYKSSDTYVEYFHEIYIQQVEESIIKNCSI